MNKYYYLAILLFFLNSCSTFRNGSLESQILKKEKLSKRDYCINIITLIDDGDIVLLGYNCREKDVLLPSFIDGKRFDILIKINDDLHFFSDDENYNIKSLNQFKSLSTKEKSKIDINTYFDEYKKGFVIVD